MQTHHSAPLAAAPLAAAASAPNGIAPHGIAPHVIIIPARPISPLMLSDRLITLAQEADRAGHPATATTLIDLAFSVLDGKRMQ